MPNTKQDNQRIKQVTVKDNHTSNRKPALRNRKDDIHPKPSRVPPPKIKDAGNESGKDTRRDAGRLRRGFSEAPSATSNGASSDASSGASSGAEAPSNDTSEDSLTSRSTPKKETKSTNQRSNKSRSKDSSRSDRAKPIANQVNGSDTNGTVHGNPIESATPLAKNFSGSTFYSSPNASSLPRPPFSKASPPRAVGAPAVKGVSNSSPPQEGVPPASFQHQFNNNTYPVQTPPVHPSMHPGMHPNMNPVMNPMQAQPAPGFPPHPAQFLPPQFIPPPPNFGMHYPMYPMGHPMPMVPIMPVPPPPERRV